MSADDGITCEEDLPLHRKGEELRRGRMEHNFQRRAAQRDANLARLGDLRREPRCKHRQEGGSQHAEVERVIVVALSGLMMIFLQLLFRALLALAIMVLRVSKVPDTLKDT